jgi:hypothetical protein
METTQSLSKYNMQRDWDLNSEPSKYEARLLSTYN